MVRRAMVRRAMVRRAMVGSWILLPLFLFCVPAWAEEPTDAQRYQAVVASIVEYKPGPPGLEHITQGYDANGRLVWTSGDWGAIAYRRDADGKILEALDGLGNSTLYFENNAEGWDRRIVTNVNTGTQAETTHFIPSNEEVYLGCVHPVDADCSTYFRTLGLDPEKIPAEMVLDEGAAEGGTEWTTYVNAASKTTAHSRPDPPAGMWHEKVTTEVAGKSLTVTEAWAEDGSKSVQDDQGGGYRVVYGDGGETYEDAFGLVARREEDSEGRTVKLYVGEIFLVEYLYDGPVAKEWSAKRVVDRRDGSEVYRWNRPTPPGSSISRSEVNLRPRFGAVAQLASTSNVAEWDSVLSPNGFMIANLNASPYALVPLDGQGQVAWRSIHPWERIDFNKDRIRLHLATDLGGTRERSTPIVLSLPRNEKDTTGDIVPAGSSLPGLIYVPPLACASGVLCIVINDEITVVDDPSPAPPPPLPPPQPGGGSPGGGGGNGGGHPPDTSCGATKCGGLPGKALLAKKAKGLKRATDRLKDVAGCRDLILEYLPPEERDRGVQAAIDRIRLPEWRYHPISTTCRTNPGIGAWTGLGWDKIYMCDSFRHLSDNEAAVKVLHETLHTLGAPEAPGIPNAPPPSFYDQLVRDACNLGSD